MRLTTIVLIIFFCKVSYSKTSTPKSTSSFQNLSDINFPSEPGIISMRKSLKVVVSGVYSNENLSFESIKGLSSKNFISKFSPGAELVVDFIPNSQYGMISKVRYQYLVFDNELNELSNDSTSKTDISFGIYHLNKAGAARIAGEVGNNSVQYINSTEYNRDLSIKSAQRHYIGLDARINIPVYWSSLPRTDLTLFVGSKYSPHEKINGVMFSSTLQSRIGLEKTIPILTYLFQTGLHYEASDFQVNDLKVKNKSLIFKIGLNFGRDHL